MIRWTTPTITLTLADCAFSDIDKLIITLRQDNVTVEKTDASYSVSDNTTTIVFNLTESETGAFSAGKAAKGQINYTYSSNGVMKHGATKTFSIPIEDNEKEGALL